MISDDYYGDRFRWFVGIVKDVGDDRSRVRVRIFGIHHTEDLERVSDGDLPWALVMYPTTGGQAGSGNASHNLTPGTWVVGFFCDGIDSQQPIVMGVINGGPNSVNSSPPQNTNTNPSDPTGNVSNPAAAAGPIDAATGAPSTTQLEGGTNPQKCYNYFWEKLTAEGAYSGNLKCITSAIVGHLQNESGGSINPNAKNGNDWNKSEGSQASFGITQWREGKYDRYGPMLRFCGINTRVQPPNLPPLEKQLDFIWHEFHTSEKSAYNKLLVATNLEDAVAGIIYYGRSSAYKKMNGVWTVDRNEITYRNKLNEARKVYSSMSYTGSSSSSSGNKK
jgi:hypothetical protein